MLPRRIRFINLNQLRFQVFFLLAFICSQSASTRDEAAQYSTVQYSTVPCCIDTVLYEYGYCSQLYEARIWRERAGRGATDPVACEDGTCDRTDNQVWG